MESKKQTNFSEQAESYLDKAKYASDMIDPYLELLDKFEEQEKEIDEQQSSPQNKEQLEIVRTKIEYTQSKVHLFHIKMLTHMEQYRIHKELANLWETVLL